MTDVHPAVATRTALPTTEEESVALVDELCLRYRNWGRWGADDQRGTLNFVTPAALTHAATMIRTGRVVSCGLPFDSNGPQSGNFGGRTNPVHSMLQDGGDIALGAQDHLAMLRYTDDAVSMPLQCGTQWDALAHIFYRGQMYNGHGLEHVTSTGAAVNGIDGIADGVVGRGILLDVPRHRGVDWLSAGESIDDVELAACAAAQGVEVRSGDIVLVRTGQIAEVRARLVGRLRLRAGARSRGRRGPLVRGERDRRARRRHVGRGGPAQRHARGVPTPAHDPAGQRGHDLR